MLASVKRLLGGRSGPGVPQSAADYQTGLAPILEDHGSVAEARLTALLAALPKAARRVDIGIHGEQEFEGAFSVIVHLDGPDLATLNQAVSPHRVLFAVTRTAEGFAPAVPALDPFDVPFDPYTALWQTVAPWVAARWTVVAGPDHLAGRIFLHDGVGLATSGPLRAGA